MAKVWPVYEGSPSTVGKPWAELPLEDSVRVFDLSVSHFIAPLGGLPNVGDSKENLTWKGYKNVLIEVSDEESSETWKAGFYKSPLSPTEAFMRLKVHNELKHAWRDEWKKGEDSDGERAIYLWATLKAEAPKSEWNFDKRHQILRTIKNIRNESSIDEWIFVRFRQENEAEVS